jgi:hypothetical protein
MPVLSDWSADEMEMSIIRRDQAYTPERVGQVITFLKESRYAFV